MLNRNSLLLAFVLVLTSCVAGRSSGRVDNYTPFPDYLTPLMYGAVGDGKHDDTDALRKALFESNKQGKVLYFPSGYRFKVTGTLNYYNNEYQSYTLNLLGCIPIRRGEYVPSRYGGIEVAKGVSLFKSAKFYGSIERMCITGKRDLNVSFFDQCDCRGLVMYGNNISNFGSLFLDTSLHSVCQITHNTFLTLYYFSRFKNVASGCIDSFISFNYIDGGDEMDDNSCFEWGYYNGTVISNNFVDYYRTIYSPKTSTKQAFDGPQSYSNEYQVFRYFYYVPGDFNVVTFSSVADAFNWNDPETLEKIQRFKPITYKGKDGKVYEIPPYVAMCHSTWRVSVQNAKIEGKMKSLVFVHSTLTEYEHNRFEVSFVGNDPYKKGQINYKKGDAKPYYNSGHYPQNEMKINGIIEVVDELPQAAFGWSSSVHGRIVKTNGQVYKLKNIFDGKKWKTEWCKE